MRILPAILSAALLLTAGTAPAAKRADPEARLAEALKGRVAGTPTDCIYQRDIRTSRIIDRTGIIYQMNNGVYYLNRPQSGANFLDWGDILVTDTHSPRLCSIDIVRLIDQTSRMPSGSLGLGSFVPYTKAGDTRRR